MASKFCSRCNITKSVNDFNKSTRNGYQSKCKLCCVEVRREWVNNNREHYNEYFRNRRATNPQHRICDNTHKRLRNLLSRGSYSIRTENIIGCDKKTFLDWITFNFENNMCWATHGSLWEFDLITPASAFDLTNEQQLLACFNWRNNIRPCLKNDNARIYNFIDPFAVANQQIRVLAFIRKLRQIRLEHFLNNIE